MSEVTLIDIPTKDLPAALESGKVDAIAVFEPYIYMTTELLHDKAVLLPGSKLYRLSFNLVAAKKFPNHNPELLKKIIRGLDRAIEFINSDKEKVISLIAKETNTDRKFFISI